MSNSYVDFLAPEGRLQEGETVFALNTFDIDRETYKLAVGLLNSRITEKRLEPSYLDRLILKPLQAGVDFAAADLAAAETELLAQKDKYEVGLIDALELSISEAQVLSRKALWERAKIDLMQRNIEIEGQIRRLKAEQVNLNESIALNMKIREINSYKMPFDGNLIQVSYKGAFVEEGDLICTIKS